MASQNSGIVFKLGGFVDSDEEGGGTSAKVPREGSSLLQFMKKTTKVDNSKSDEGGKVKKGKGRMSRSVEKGGDKGEEKGQNNLGVTDGAKVVLVPKKRSGTSLEKFSRGEDSVARIKGITTDLLRYVTNCGLGPDNVLGVAELAGKYEAVIMELLLEQENLKGRLEVLGKGGLVKPVVPSVTGVVAAPVAPVPTIPVPVSKPVETWSVVVRSKNAAVTPKEVVDKVVKDVGPTLGVRVHEVRPIRGGGAVIRAPSVAERNKIAENRKFSEVGLEVKLNEKRRGRVVVQKVFSQISPDKFMEELYEKNLMEHVTLDFFKKDVRMVVPPWKEDPNQVVTVILECSDNIINALLGNRRCYIMWHSFPVREYRQSFGCYRCMSHDHVLKECRVKGVVCRRCGQEGHVERQCGNALFCRNCAFRGRASGHLMVSTACPLYCALVERANARHYNS